MPDLQAIQCALLVYDHSSIRSAAARLKLQPSAVSRRLRSLEDSIGVTLFSRNNAGAQPTFAGRRFLERARWALAEIDEAVSSARSDEKGRSGIM